MFFLPAAMTDRLGTLELRSIAVCSARPGVPARPGQNVEHHADGAKVTARIPLLKPNDWVYLDLTWVGGFARGGAAFAAGQVPLVDFHPQVAIEIIDEQGRPAVVLIIADNAACLRGGFSALIPPEFRSLAAAAGRFSGVDKPVYVDGVAITKS